MYFSQFPSNISEKKKKKRILPKECCNTLCLLPLSRCYFFLSNRRYNGKICLNDFNGATVGLPLPYLPALKGNRRKTIGSDLNTKQVGKGEGGRGVCGVRSGSISSIFETDTVLRKFPSMFESRNHCFVYINTAIVIVNINP